MAEKVSRDKQLKEEKVRKKNMTREQYNAEVELVRRLQNEMD